MSLTELSHLDKMKSYAKYYYKAPEPISREVLELLEKGPASWEHATPVAERNELLKPGYLPVEIGYSVFPDGTGFAAMLTQMPGVTLEMLDWWFMWHSIDGLRYRIWCPTEHFGARVAQDSLVRRLDRTRSIQERTWGTTDLVYENVGGGPANIYISFQSPRDYGLDQWLLNGGQRQTVICANAGLSDSNNPIITFMHTAREIPGGVEMRSRFWEGWHVVEGKPVKVAPPNGVALGAVKGCSYHAAVEYTNLASILPDLYRENKDIADTAVPSE